MRSLSVSDFREQCLALIEHLPKGGVLITKRGKPVAKLVPVEEIDNSWIMGSLKGTLEIADEALSTGIPWDAES